MVSVIQNLSARTVFALSTLAIVIGIGLQPPKQAYGFSASSYYVDCAARRDGSGTQSSPINSLSTINGLNLKPGDHLFFRRGTACVGHLAPQGSGVSGAPIVIDAFGEGTLPLIRGGDDEEVLRLFNQQYWEINHLDITGGHRYGIYISGDTPNSVLHHIYLRYLEVHGATYTSTKRADSGEVVLSNEAAAQTFEDVLIDAVSAHDSHVSEGIFVTAGGKWIEAPGVSQPLGRNVTVQNSTAHDVYGDGILISELSNGLLQRNTVYRSGLCPTCTGSTPVGLWEWYCHTCTVQYNESYSNDSWDGDGGDFDIDYYNDDNIVQYNYGHDSAGYCVAVFGAGGRATHNSIVRYNICSNNGRKSTLAHQGEVFVHTWEGGSLDGVQIYNNTFYWNPAANAPAFSADDAVYSGTGPRFFKNNIVYATVPQMVHATEGFGFDNNIYFTSSSQPPSWQIASTNYFNLKEYQAGTQQDMRSYSIDPLLRNPTYHSVGRPVSAFELLPQSPGRQSGVNVCGGIAGCSMGAHDFWDHPLPSPTGYNIGAYQGH